VVKLLLIIPNLHPERGEAPVVPEGAYVGYYNAGTRQLLFVFDAQKRVGLLYLSSAGWGRHFEIVDGRLPEDILLNGSEAGWALACWRAAIGR
jgi:hypothetical protein